MARPTRNAGPQGAPPKRASPLVITAEEAGRAEETGANRLPPAADADVVAVDALVNPLSGCRGRACSTAIGTDRHGSEVTGHTAAEPATTPRHADRLPTLIVLVLLSHALRLLLFRQKSIVAATRASHFVWSTRSFRFTSSNLRGDADSV